MSPRDKARAKKLTHEIRRHEAKLGPLPGLSAPGHMDTLVAQFIDSLRRIEFAHYLRDARHHPARMDPASEIFDPLRAAVLYSRRGQNDEAWWLVFLATHFGKHSVDGWRLTRDVYGKLGQGSLWDWATISVDPNSFCYWLAANAYTLKGGDGISRRFSNHRKYESLNASSDKGTAGVLSSYITWVAPPRTHDGIIRAMHKLVGQDPHIGFSTLYDSMSTVRRFGRLAKFDFLAMLGKLGLAPIEPGSTFLKGATGPLKGARLMFGGNLQVQSLESKLITFGQNTGLGAQVLEDALCNWQKSPGVYKRFKG